MNTTELAALRNRIDELADDVGRLRRRFNSNPDAWTGVYIADRIAQHVQAVHQLLEPTAAELAATTAPGDPEAVNEAIRIVDERSRKLGGRLGGIT